MAARRDAPLSRKINNLIPPTEASSPDEFIGEFAEVSNSLLPVSNESPGALAGATGAGSIELAFRSTDYRMRAEAATSLCLAIANCAPQDAVIVMSAALADLIGQVVA